jgi:hypothetical protein
MIFQNLVLSANLSDCIFLPSDLGSRWGGSRDAVRQLVHVVEQGTPGLSLHVEAVLSAEALVGCPPKFCSPRHISFAVTRRVFTETVQWTSRRTAYGAVMTAATFLRHSCYLP